MLPGSFSHKCSACVPLGSQALSLSSTSLDIRGGLRELFNPARACLTTSNLRSPQLISTEQHWLELHLTCRLVWSFSCQSGTSQVRASQNKKKKRQPTNHFSILGILAMSGWLRNGWMAGGSVSLRSEDGTTEQSRAAPVSPSIKYKNNHHKEKARKGQAKETMLVCSSSDVYHVCSSALKISTQLFLFSLFSLFTERMNKMCFASSSLGMSSIFPNLGFLLPLISQYGVKKKK